MNAGSKIAGTLMLLLLFLSITMFPTVHPIPIHKNNSIDDNTSPVYLKLVYGAMPPIAAVVDPNHTIFYNLTFLTYDPINEKIVWLGNIAGSGTSFIPGKILNSIKKILIDLVSNKYNIWISLHSTNNTRNNNNEYINATIIESQKLIPLNKIMVPLIVIATIYYPINNTCAEIYIVPYTTVLDAEKIADNDYPSIIMRININQLKPSWIIWAPNKTSNNQELIPQDILPALTPFPEKVLTWISRLGVDINIRIEKSIGIAPLVMAWHGNIVNKGFIQFQANITPVDDTLYFYTCIRSPSTSPLLTRYLGLRDAVINLNFTSLIQGLSNTIPGAMPGYPGLIGAGLMGVLLRVSIEVTPSTQLHKVFRIREIGEDDVKLELFIPSFTYHDVYQGFSFNTAYVYYWINLTCPPMNLTSWTDMIIYDWYLYLQKISNKLVTIQHFTTGNRLYYSYKLDDVVLATSYFDIGFGKVFPVSRDINTVLLGIGRVNISVSLLEESNKQIGKVTLEMHWYNDRVIDALIISTGPSWSNISLTGLSSHR